MQLTINGVGFFLPCVYYAAIHNDWLLVRGSGGLQKGKEGVCRCLTLPIYVPQRVHLISYCSLRGYKVQKT